MASSLWTRVLPTSCDKPGKEACSSCFLVLYCCKKCQRAHWSCHKGECRSTYMKSTLKPDWDVENPKPFFISPKGTVSMIPDIYVGYGGGKVPWGNVPAYNILNLAKNESVDASQNFRLLFAASGDLRNAVKTVVDLPQPYGGTCEVFLNEKDDWLVSRNTILLLTAFTFDAKAAAVIMMHLWYSALIPKEMLQAIRSKVYPLIEAVSIKTKDRPAGALISKKWTFGTSSFRLVMQKHYWDMFGPYFENLKYFSFEDAVETRTFITLAPERADFLQRRLYTYLPSRRLCHLKYRNDGLLLPFGYPRGRFTIPNPTLYRQEPRTWPVNSAEEVWPVTDSSDPLDGWPAQEVNKVRLVAKNDIYRRLHHYLLDQFEQFSQKIKDGSVKFHLFNINWADLPHYLSQYGLSRGTFDILACKRGPSLRNSY